MKVYHDQKVPEPILDCIDTLRPVTVVSLNDVHTTAAIRMLAQSIDRCSPTQLPTGAPSQTYSLPVDAEDKACSLNLCSVARPHMRAFYTSWLALFSTFVATIAPAALLPVLRDDLDLTATDIGNAGIASVCGAIGSRLVMGSLTDILGPRYAAAIVLLGTTPFVFGMTLIHNAASFVAMRMLVGLSLSMFVVNQHWMTQMFNTKLVGRANALSAGWGNTGAGASLLLMPLLYEAFAAALAPHLAWRVAFFVPGALQLVLGFLALLCTDDEPAGTLPLVCRDRVHRRRTNPRHAWQSALLNYRTYMMALAYALCFGVELTTDNVISFYMFSHFGLSLTTSGILGGVLGLMNLGSRFLGGAASDFAGGLRGMRGRLWVLQVLLAFEGVFCLLVGISHESLPATLAMLFIFSFFCQAACGAVFGITPFVSKRSTGMVVGVVACGGNVGSAVMQAVFFSYFGFTTYEGFYWMGTTVLCLGALVGLTYWPMWGGMCCPAQAGQSEERYYIAEYNMNERAAGLHLPALAFAHESRSERDNVGCCAGAEAYLRDASHRNGSNHSRLGLIAPGLQLVASMGRKSGSVHGRSPVASPPLPVAPMQSPLPIAAAPAAAAEEEDGPGPDSLYAVAPRYNASTVAL